MINHIRCQTKSLLTSKHL